MVSVQQRTLLCRPGGSACLCRLPRVTLPTASSGPPIPRGSHFPESIGVSEHPPPPRVGRRHGGGPVGWAGLPGRCPLAPNSLRHEPCVCPKESVRGGQNLNRNPPGGCRSRVRAPDASKGPHSKLVGVWGSGKALLRTGEPAWFPESILPAGRTQASLMPRKGDTGEAVSAELTPQAEFLWRLAWPVYTQDWADGVSLQGRAKAGRDEMECERETEHLAPFRGQHLGTQPSLPRRGL